MIKMSSAEQFLTSTEILNLGENCSMLCEELSLGVPCYLSTPRNPGTLGTSSEAAGTGGCPEAAQEGL